MVETVQGVFTNWMTGESPKKGDDDPPIVVNDIEIQHPEEEFKHEFEIIAREQFNRASFNIKVRAFI